MTIETIAGGHITTPRGFRAGAVCAGMYAGGAKAGALDLALLVSDRPCAVAAVFTTNLVKGAPVVLSQERVAAGRVRAIVANSGCANSLNGPGGYEDAKERAGPAGKQLGIDPEEVAVASTGVTGVRMPMEKIRAGIPKVAVAADGGPALARAIMTTDTRPKESAVSAGGAASPVGRRYAVGGCAKGSGMIHPDMATMFTFVTTDAEVEPGFLRAIQREVA